MTKLNHIIIFGFLLSAMTACNANTKTDSSAAVNTSNKKETVSTKGAEPIPQPGGYSNIDNAKLKELTEQGVLLVDIRLKEEWQQTGIVEGSKTITFFDRTGNINPNFVPEFTALAKPDQPVMLICRTGNRTQAASRAIAEQLGYKNVMNVTNGITGWMAEKRPVSSYN
ncbi:rhodanese-like domain-containing protein [uncultured Cocleimonas sp.]|uniref:rhodanese-like domain-containing protein n=1 Tax=uncultured Cocleimonas sp. TaxID=1051587 RepID=UPI00261015A4|nr:rhodanese-like domain-containing protein [uncultured Cocleimonas sp.]